jgi:sugar phosphate isomerase/epimerase
MNGFGDKVSAHAFKIAGGMPVLRKEVRMNRSNELTRRGFMRFGAGVVAAVGAANLGQSTAGAAGAKKIPIGLQLYSVRSEAQKDPAGVIAQVAEMGYEGVEFAGYYGWSAEKLRKLLDQHGLKCCGTHTGMNTLMGDHLPKTIEFNKTLGNKYLIVPGIGGTMRPDSRNSWVLFAKLMSEVAARAAEHGMRAGYHNHAWEFEPLGKDIPWEVFAANSSKDVILQVDIGHVVRAGADPAKHMARYPGRLTTVHIKEYSKTSRDPLVGEGDVDWPAMFRICEGPGGTEWYIIEDESANQPLQRVRKDLENLRGLLAKHHA